jgi:O-antigen/teichoic acid export membrane protein
MSIARNASFMTGASIIQKIIAFGYFTIIARAIGAEGLGKYVFALSFTTVFVVFVDLGLTSVIVREAARAKGKIQQYLSTVLAVKMILGVLSYAGAVLTIHLMGYPAETRHLVYLSAVTMLFDSLHLTMYGMLRAIGHLKYEAAAMAGSQLLTMILGSFFLWQGYPLIFLILAFTIPSALNALFAGSVLYYKYHITIIPAYDHALFKKVATIAVPFALAAIFARVYSYIDSILLSKMAGDVAVGWYAIPHKITFAFQFLPLALIAPLYPRFSEYYVTNKKRLAHVFERALKYLLVLSFPIAVGIGVLAEDIVIGLFTAEYAASVAPLRILLASLVFSFLSFPIGSFLNACNKQVTQTKIVGAVLICNVTANVLLIPTYGVVGAATAAFIGNMLLTIIGYAVVPKVIDVSHRFLIKATLQIVLSAAVMGTVVLFVNSYAHFGVAIGAGALVYLVMLFLTTAVSRRDVQEARLLIRG